MDDIIAADVEETEAKMMLTNEVSDETLEAAPRICCIPTPPLFRVLIVNSVD